jgi:hypothetical protein
VREKQKQNKRTRPGVGGTKIQIQLVDGSDLNQSCVEGILTAIVHSQLLSLDKQLLIQAKVEKNIKQKEEQGKSASSRGMTRLKAAPRHAQHLNVKAPNCSSNMMDKILHMTLLIPLTSILSSEGMSMSYYIYFAFLSIVA